MAMDTIKIDNKTVRMVAHRGLSGLEKENTCSAFVAACNRATYFGVETDVHRTADGRYIEISAELPPYSETFLAKIRKIYGRDAT